MMRERFQAGDFEAGSIAAVRAVSAILAERFRLATARVSESTIRRADRAMTTSILLHSVVRSLRQLRRSHIDNWRPHHVD